MKEKVVIIFIAVTLGLLATTVGFFLYETTKPTTVIETKNPKKEVVKIKPTPDIILKLTSPNDETVSNTRTISVKGTTNPENTVIISTNSNDIAVAPAGNGNFNANITIDNGVDVLEVEAITPNGESIKEIRTVSYSSEEF